MHCFLNPYDFRFHAFLLSGLPFALRGRIWTWLYLVNTKPVHLAYKGPLKNSFFGNFKHFG